MSQHHLAMVNPAAFRTAYRTALAWFYREENPELLHEYRFPDGSWLSSYLNSGHGVNPT